MVPTAAFRILAGGVAISLLLGAQLASLAAQARERVLYVNAFDRNTHQPVADLGVKDFIVREDGVQREVLRVARATSPMPVALLIDNTQAATNAIADIRRAVTAFINTADGIGPIALIAYADRPTILVDYTTSSKALLDGVGRIFATPSSGATLLDAVRETARGLGKREADRAAIVVISTEGTEFSTLHYQQVLDAVRESGAALSAVVLLNPNSPMLQDEIRNRATVLDRGPREHGGIRFDVLAASAFEDQLRNVAAILKSQYRVVYGRPDSLIPPERIDVSAAGPGVETQGSPARGSSAK